MNEEACTSCGNTPAILVEDQKEMLCVKCIRRSHTHDLVEQHLEAVINPVIQKWAQHWTEAGIKKSFLVHALETFIESNGGAGEFLNQLSNELELV